MACGEHRYFITHFVFDLWDIKRTDVVIIFIIPTPLTAARARSTLLLMKQKPRPNQDIYSRDSL